ncbi:XrtA system polysaccharide chain length determinant [Sphingomonas sp.]|uniref:XrtA system polysaccharide chain length determinant n=1 Tax=Sphingomonas sp. TaxID=28214 RepID=UPI0025DAED7C|nr:XrtA system polysaccharide chain length determinant [Sphingomonas sp.]
MNGLYDELLVALHGVWLRRWLVLGVGWGIALAGWAVIGLIPNRYESVARILIQTQSLLPDKVGITSQDRQQGIESVRQTLTSTVNLQQVVRGTDLAQRAKTDKEVADTATGLAKNIKIVSQQDNLFEISASSGDTGLSDAANARLSRQIVQKLIDLFVDGNLAGGRIETGQTLKFLNAQLDIRGKQLADAEAKRQEFSQKYMALLPGAGSISDRIDAARTEISRIDSDLSAAQSGLAAVNGQLASTPAATRTSGVMSAGSAGDGRAAIQAQISDGQARGWTNQHPDMVALRSQLARTPTGSGGAGRMSPGTSTPNPMYVSLRSMQAEKQAVAGALASRKAQIQGQINSVLAAQAANPEMAAQQTELDRNYTVLKSQYDKMLNDREDVKLRGQVQTQTDSVKFSVIDPPSAPRVPAAPNRPLLLTLVLLVGIGAGAGVAFAMGQLRKTYATAPRLASASGLPVLGSIGEVIPLSEKTERIRKLKLFAGAGAALAVVYAIQLIVEFVQRSMVA